MKSLIIEIDFSEVAQYNYYQQGQGRILHNRLCYKAKQSNSILVLSNVAKSISVSHSVSASSLLFHYAVDPFNLHLRNISNPDNFDLVVTCSDLHHGQMPLTRIVPYLTSVQARAAIVPYNPSIANLLNKYFIPAIPRTFDDGTTLPFSGPSQWIDRSNTLLHCGSLSQWHPRRTELVARLVNYPAFCQYNGVYSSIWDRQCNSMFTLNIPLSIDRNLRFWQLLLSGSLMFMSAIPRGQFCDLPFSRGDLDADKYFVTFKSYDELIEKHSYYSTHLLESEDIASRGFDFANSYLRKGLLDEDYILEAYAASSQRPRTPLSPDDASDLLSQLDKYLSRKKMACWDNVI